MRAHEVYVHELNKSFPILAGNIFDAAIFVIGEQSPGWIRNTFDVRVVNEPEVYSFRADRFGDKVEFTFGETQ